MAQKTDETLMLEAGQGDFTAFEALIKRYQDRMLNFFIRFMGSETLAQDFVQELFLRAFQARERYRPTAAFSTWLYTIAHRLCLDEKRKAVLRRTVSLDEPMGGDSRAGREVSLRDVLADGVPDALSRMGQAEKESVVRAVIQSLPLDFRSFLVLSVYEGLGYQEIADITGVRVEAVRMRSSRAHKALKQKMEKLREELS